MIIQAEGTKQVNYPSKKSPPLWGNLAGVMEVANEGFQLPPLTETLGGPLFKFGNNRVSFRSGQASLKPIGVEFNPEDS